MEPKQIHMEADPTLELEPNPDLVEAFKAYLDEYAFADYLDETGVPIYEGQHSSAFLIVFEGDSIAHRQINPQAAQPIDNTIDTQNAGNVGSGGHNPADDTP